MTETGAPRTCTHPDVFTIGIEQGWAEAETDPTRIDWPARQAAAAISFEVIDGRPVNPCAETGIRYGRNEMGYWGETLMADALVTAMRAGRWYLLMVERGDGYGWAVPGGHVEPGETGAQAAARELAEETGLAVPPEFGHVAEPLYVPDPRASDEAWAVTIPVRFDLGQLAELPAVAGADDARRAAWVAAGSYSDLAVVLDRDYTGCVFAAHVGMLSRFLPNGATPTDHTAIDEAVIEADRAPVPDYMETYEAHWKEIVEKPDGTLNRDQVARELAGYGDLMGWVSEVYLAVTGGLLSEPNTAPCHIIEAVNERIDEGGAAAEITVPPAAGQDGLSAKQEIRALFTATDGSPLSVKITMFQLADGRIGVGVYPTEASGTVLRWDDGPQEDPLVIYWAAPHCADDVCGAPCGHKGKS